LHDAMNKVQVSTPFQVRNTISTAVYKLIYRTPS